MRLFKKNNWMYYPVSLLGFVIVLITLFFIIETFVFVDARSHSVSDTFYGVLPYFISYLVMSRSLRKPRHLWRGDFLSTRKSFRFSVQKKHRGFFCIQTSRMQQSILDGSQEHNVLDDTSAFSNHIF